MIDIAAMTRTKGQEANDEQKEGSSPPKTACCSRDNESTGPIDNGAIATAAAATPMCACES
jgi:hypothetical protein